MKFVAEEGYVMHMQVKPRIKIALIPQQSQATSYLLKTTFLKGESIDSYQTQALCF